MCGCFDGGHRLGDAGRNLPALDTNTTPAIDSTRSVDEKVKPAEPDPEIQVKGEKHIDSDDKNAFPDHLKPLLIRGAKAYATFAPEVTVPKNANYTAKVCFDKNGSVGSVEVDYSIGRVPFDVEIGERVFRSGDAARV